jgi:hypothetical protein
MCAYILMWLNEKFLLSMVSKPNEKKMINTKIYINMKINIQTNKK